MDQQKFEQMMAEWAEKEQQAVPELRPTREMYNKVRAKRQLSWFPFLNRWATISVAAIALIISILVLRPQFFQSSKDVGLVTEQEQLAEEAPSEALLRKEAPRPAALPESEAPLIERENVVLDTEEEPMSEAQDRAALKAGRSAPMDKDSAASGVKKEDAGMAEGVSQTARESFSPVAEEKAPEVAQPPSPVRRDVRSRIMPHDSLEPAETVAVGSAKPQAAPPVSEKRKGRAFEPPSMLADDMEQNEESNVGLLRLPGRAGAAAAPKVFDLHEGVWIDREHSPEKITIPIKRNSPAFRDLLAAKPELKTYSDRYYHIIINLGAQSVEISANGKSELSPEELNSLLQQ